jgi:hypothetical protein
MFTVRRLGGIGTSDNQSTWLWGLPRHGFVCMLVDYHIRYMVGRVEFPTPQR